LKTGLTCCEFALGELEALGEFVALWALLGLWALLASCPTLLGKPKQRLNMEPTAVLGRLWRKAVRRACRNEFGCSMVEKCIRDMKKVIGRR
jgi:hypothetical protein